MSPAPASPAPPSEVTGLLRAWANGDAGALEKLTPAVYEELRRIAKRYTRRERPGHTLQTAALVNEAYLRLVDADAIEWKDRVHFFAVSAQVMRRILVDSARAKATAKRGAGGHIHDTVNLNDIPDEGQGRGKLIIALDDALKTLAEIDPRKAKVVELRYFGGLSVQETAEALNLSEQSVMRDWRLAKAWLQRQMGVSS
jgi:RNA polymerase sigma factor (TIGR02999 family)